MIRRSQLMAAMLIAATSWTAHLGAQPASVADRGGRDALRRQIERRFDPLPLRDGVNLRPKTPMRGVRSIEITGGTIAVDGTAVTGAELRQRIGDDADLVIQLSYLDVDAQRVLFGATPSAGTPAPDAPPPVPAVAPPVQPDRSSPRNRSDRFSRRGNDRVRFGESVTIGPGEIVDGDVAVIGGSAHIEGTVRGDVVAVGGNIDIGPRAIVEGDVTVVGGSVHRADGARIDGNVKDVSFGRAFQDSFKPSNWSRRWSMGNVSPTFAFIATITRVVVTSLLAALVVLLAGTQVDRIGLRAAAEPIKAGVIGFLAQLLFLPLLIVTVLVLVVTVFGIPLLVLIPFLVLGLALIALVGFTSVARLLGQRVGERLGWTNPSPYFTTVAGIAAIVSPLLLARLALVAGGTGVSALWHVLAFCGLFVEYLAWTVGFGAVALARFGKSPLFTSNPQRVDS